MSKKSAVVVGCIFLLVIWFLWPIYQFYAHKGEAPFLPFGVLTLPNETPQNAQVLDTRLSVVSDKLLEDISKHRQSINSPGISVAVAVENKLVWTGVAGWADVEKGVVVSPHTQFRIGSTSKSVTATALARLVDKGNIDLEAPLSQYQNNLPNPQWYDIKVRHLASHQSGLPHYKQFDDMYGLYKSITLNTHYEDVVDALALFDDTKLLFLPGTDFSYSTYGTVLLSSVMQAATGKSFLNVMHSEVFAPLGLKATQAEHQAEKGNNLASCYWNNGGKDKKVRVWRDVDLSHRLAGGGFVSTSSDLVTLGSGFINEQYISKQTRNVMWTPQQRLDNGEMNEQTYALGWRVQDSTIGDEQLLIAHHGGVSRGAQSFLVVIPEYKLVIAININAKTHQFSDFSKIWKDIALSVISNIK